MYCAQYLDLPGSQDAKVATIDRGEDGTSMDPTTQYIQETTVAVCTCTCTHLHHPSVIIANLSGGNAVNVRE